VGGEISGSGIDASVAAAVSAATFSHATRVPLQQKPRSASAATVLQATGLPLQLSQLMRRKRGRLRSTKPEFHHNVYVVLLSKAALKDLSILRRNPARDPSKPAVYVGLTGLPVDHRFENHKNGYKSARLVRNYGVRLLPELFEHLNPMPYEHAVQMEKDLADDLRAQGFAVCGGT
jgi:hypothetical protein